MQRDKDEMIYNAYVKNPEMTWSQLRKRFGSCSTKMKAASERHKKRLQIIVVLAVLVLCCCTPDKKQEETLRNSLWYVIEHKIYYYYDNNYHFALYNKNDRVFWFWKNGFPRPYGFEYFRDIDKTTAEGFAYGEADDMYHFQYVEFDLKNDNGTSTNFRIFKDGSPAVAYQVHLVRSPLEEAFCLEIIIGACP